MNSLYKVLNLWDNLEDYYSSNNFASYSDMYKKLLGFNQEDNSTSLDYILSRINMDMGNDSDISKVSELSEKLEKVSILLTNGTEINSSDIDTAIKSVSTRVESVNTIITDEFIQSLVPYSDNTDRVNSSEEISLSNALKTTGAIGTIITSTDDEVNVTLVESISDDYVLFYGNITIKELHRIVQEKINNNENCLFLVDCILALSNLIEMEVIKESRGVYSKRLLMLNKNYYSLDSDKGIVSLKIGNIVKELGFVNCAGLVSKPDSFTIRQSVDLEYICAKASISKYSDGIDLLLL